MPGESGPGRVKLAYIGGGSLFVPSVVNGAGQVLKQSRIPFEVDLALYDVLPDKAERMRAYAGIVRERWGVPLRASVATSRAEALAGADVVLVSVWLQDEHERIERLLAAIGYQPPEEGPGIAAWAVACAPWSLGVAAEMREHCPDALFLTLMNPTDVIAGVVAEGGGVRAAGLCVEVDGLRGALAYYLRVPSEQIELTHAGVNHDGWVLDLRVAGRDGYALLQSRWDAIARDPDFHPGNRGLQPIFDLTGRLRSSAYHHWPYQVAESGAQRALWERWRGKREMHMRALDEALQARQPISDPPRVHPERSRLNYPHTGLTIGRLLQSVATGQASVIPLQVPNRGAIPNFPAEAMVEVPTRVQGRTLVPQPVGELPEWLGGYTRLLAIQRRLVVEYVLGRDLATLKRALAVLPMFGTVQQLNGLAEALHREFGSARL